MSRRRTGAARKIDAAPDTTASAAPAPTPRDTPSNAPSNAPRDTTAVGLVRFCGGRVIRAYDVTDTATRRLLAFGDESGTWRKVRDRLAPGARLEQRKMGRWIPVTAERLRRCGEKDPGRYVASRAEP